MPADPNPFLLYETKNDKPDEKVKQRAAAATELINCIVGLFKESFQVIESKYSDVGVGDTVTREAVGRAVLKAISEDM